MGEQLLGVIVCGNCNKEIEFFEYEQVITHYGLCFDCKSNDEKIKSN